MGCFERWMKEGEKTRRTNGYFPVFVFRFPRSRREFTAEVTCSLYLHCLPFLPCLPSEESKSCSRRPTRLSLQGVSVIAAALARQLSSLSFRLSYSPQHRSFALLCYGLCKFFSGLLRHARRALIDPNRSYLCSPYRG